MGKFARIIELENGEQVLLKKGQGEDEAPFELKVTTEIDNCEVSITLVYKNEQLMDSEFDSYTEEKAIKFRKGIEAEFFS